MLLGWDRLTTDDEDRIARSVVENRMHGGPWALEIQPTNRCNVDCFFCSSRGHRHDEELPWPLLEKILRDGAAGDLRALRLSGGGESFIHPRIRQVFELCGELGIHLADVTTNGSTLATHAASIVSVGATTVSVSINEPTAELYAKTMKSPERLFGRVLEGVRALRAARDAAPPERRPELILKFMIWKGNAHLLGAIHALAGELGADTLLLNNICGLLPEERMGPEDLASARAALTDMIAEHARQPRFAIGYWLDGEQGLQEHAMLEMARHGLKCHAEGVDSKAPEPAAGARQRRTEYCLMGWYSATIAATGTVYPCCNFVGLPGKDMGSLHGSTLAEVWEGAAYALFRREFRQHILLRGRMEQSRRLHRYIEPFCIAQRECPWAWCLASPTFYHRVAGELDRQAPALERLGAEGRNGALRAAHALTGALRR